LPVTGDHRLVLGISNQIRANVETLRGHHAVDTVQIVAPGLLEKAAEKFCGNPVASPSSFPCQLHTCGKGSPFSPFTFKQRTENLHGVRALVA
jgi:hypothetical protein